MIEEHSPSVFDDLCPTIANDLSEPELPRLHLDRHILTWRFLLFLDKCKRQRISSRWNLADPTEEAYGEWDRFRPQNFKKLENGVGAAGGGADTIAAHLPAA